MILVIDEIDSLVDRNGDDILYSFTRANERLLESGFMFSNRYIQQFNI